MQAAAFILATLVLLPYVVLALAFGLLGRAISGGTLASFLEAILTQATWLVPWGLLLAACSAVVLVALGVNPSSRKLGAAILCGLALASVATITILSSKRIGLPELTFLLPCIGVAVFGAWLAKVQ